MTQNSNKKNQFFCVERTIYAQTMQKIDIMSIVRRCKNWHHVKNRSVNSANASIKINLKTSILFLSARIYGMTDRSTH